MQSGKSGCSDFSCTCSTLPCFSLVFCRTEFTSTIFHLALTVQHCPVSVFFFYSLLHCTVCASTKHEYCVCVCLDAFDNPSRFPWCIWIFSVFRCPWYSIAFVVSFWSTPTKITAIKSAKWIWILKLHHVPTPLYDFFKLPNDNLLKMLVVSLTS